MLIRLYTKVKRRDIPRLKKENVKLVAKLWEFILAIFKDPYDGIGKPEQLKGDLEGCWSRRGGRYFGNFILLWTLWRQIIYTIRNSNLFKIFSAFSSSVNSAFFIDKFPIFESW